MQYISMIPTKDRMMRCLRIKKTLKESVNEDRNI